MSDRYYRAPGPISRRLLNPLVSALTERGALPGDTVVLAVPGRISGRIRTVPLTPVPVDGHRYLISPRGQTDWVHNLRAAGGRAELRAGGDTEQIHAVEQDVEVAVAVLRTYVQGLGRAAGVVFDDLRADSSDAEYAEAADRHPVFEVTGPES